MPAHDIGGQHVEVSHKTGGFLWWRSDGITIQISPERHWWCLWLCSSTTRIDAIRGSMVLSTPPDPNTGTVHTEQGNASCQNCGGLDVMGTTVASFPAPPRQVFHFVTYNLSITVHGAVFSAAGSFSF